MTRGKSAYNEEIKGTI